MPPSSDLAMALAEAALALPGTSARPIAGGTEWLVRGRPFAAVTGDTAEFLLQPIVGRAALGTPDTTTSRRGAGWISFSPAELDRFALDRAVAWLGSAHRHVGALRN